MKFDLRLFLRGQPSFPLVDVSGKIVVHCNLTGVRQRCSELACCGSDTVSVDEWAG